MVKQSPPAESNPPRRKQSPPPVTMMPEYQKEAAQLRANAIRAWAADRGTGTAAPTFAEVSRAPRKSRKNIKR